MTKLRQKSPYSELFSSVFSRIQTEDGEILYIAPYSVQMGKLRSRITRNTDTFYTYLYRDVYYVYVYNISMVLIIST